MMKKNNYMHKAIWIPIIVLSFFLVPYLIEKLVLSISGSTFNPKFMLDKEVWFGFIGSYLGAVGTVILGIVAIWQNKRYKELSDDSSKEVMEIQGELRNLNKRIVDAIETLETIELAVYAPAIQNMHSHFYKISKETLDDRFGDCAYQINRINVYEEDMFIPLELLMEKHATYAFPIRNIGEKAIRDFTCKSIKINNGTPNVLTFSSTDIMSGEVCCLLFANLPLESGDNNIELYFEFDTLLFEKYGFNIDIFITYDDGKSFDSIIYNFEQPNKVINTGSPDMI